MDQLVENKPDIVKRETVAKTIVSKQAPDRDWLEYLRQNRKLDMLTITEPEVTEEEGAEPEGKEEKDKTNAKKRVVMVMARQHPGEGPASYVVQGKCWIEKAVNIVLIRPDWFPCFKAQNCSATQGKANF